jgi:hypothetical protein
MPAATPTAPDRVYQLKVSLRGISPLVWRRLLVRADTTIAQLHAILQIAMGWEDEHLHRFHIHGRDYGIAYSGGLSFRDDPHQVRLADFRLRKGERFRYEYDLTDCWQHDVRLEQVLAHDPKGRYPRCSGGAEACPPEDCGGPDGYRQLLDKRSSWSAIEDVLLVAERLQVFLDGGPRPTVDEADFTAALDRMHAWLEAAPSAFRRRTVNTALRQTITESPPCTSASSSSPSPTTAPNSTRRSPTSTATRRRLRPPG